MTPVLARRVGDRLLCGRRVLGDYACTGEIIRLRRGPDKWLVMFGPEYVQDPSGEVRLAARAARKLADGRAAKSNQKTGRVVGGWTIAAGPWSRKCPHCGTLATVEANLLDS